METLPVTVGVAPPGELLARPRLWQALAAVHDVRFVPVTRGAYEGLSALICVGESAAGAPRELPRLRVLGEEPAATTPAEVRLAAHAPVDARLRGASLREERWRDVPVLDRRERVTLASVGARATWTAEREGWRHASAAMPAELDAAEVLRDRFANERFLALMPILELLRHVTRGVAWQAPPLRAAFVIDDPNLHWPSYGFADFAALASAGQRHRFHVAVAAVPLDMWFAHPAAVREFHDARLSLLVHGNDHVRCELARELPERELLALAAQAQRRVARLERRTGLRIARVMAPPHGQCSQAMLRALRRAGFDAACISRPHPWLEHPPAGALSARWDVSDVDDACAPVIPRHPIGGVTQDVHLRAYLGQPIVLYGHHGDLRHGLEPLIELAGLVNSLGEVAWTGMEEIAASNYLTRRRGDEQQVRLFTRRAYLTPADGVGRMLVESGGVRAGGDVLEVRRHGSAPTLAALDEPFATPRGHGPVSLRLIAHDAIDVANEPAPAWSAWARARRVLVEARDRSRPLAARLAPSSR
jgi:hypothetical protein